MSQKVERSGQDDVLALESALGALRQSPEFRGPVEPLDDHDHSNEHFALIHESREEQFAAAIPFMRQGLERGEQCLYIADENSREDVLEAMRADGIDVDAALESGALMVQTKRDAYLRDGTFDPDEMIAFLKDAINDAIDEYETLRIAGEMTWVFSDEPDIEDLIEYEGKLNNLFTDVDSVALCQYNRERFPPEVIRDVVRTHPHLIHDNVVSQNVYYTPPEEFFGPDRPANEVDRMMGTLRDRTEAKADLEDRQRFLRESYKITSNPELSFEEKLEQLLDLGREWLGLEMAALSELPSWNGKFRLEKGLGLGVEPEEKPFWTDPTEGCFCRQTITEDAPVSQVDVRETPWMDDSIYQELGLTSYLGTKVMSGSTPYGTLWFGSTEPRERPFSDTERTFIELMGQWVSYEIERREHKQSQRELYEITADTERTFDEKLQAMFDLGCDRFDLDLGGMARIDPDTDRSEVEHVSDDHEYLEPGVEVALSETYCRMFANGGETAGITEPEAEGFDGTRAYDEFGLKSYLGTRIGLDDEFDRTLFFVSAEPREMEFSEAERTFLNLMGQWAKYELERQQRERELRERTEHLSALIETTPECIKTVAADGTLLQMNPAGLDMVEADAASAVTGECVYDLIAPEHRERFREFNERICQGEHGTLEFDIIGLEGTRRHMESHAAPLRRPDGTTVQMALTRDITDQVERKAELEETVDQLQQSNDRLKQFAYAASHDLQEPLRMVSSYLQLLENQHRDELDEDAQEYIDFAVDGADRMRAMVEDLLAYSRVEQADGEFDPIECDAVLDNVMTDLKVKIDEHDAEITAEPLPTVMADSEQLEQLFTNLISNAIKYSGEEPPQIEITADSQADHWEFAVADNGIGIDPDKADRIFEVFKRLHHDDEYPGTGIGLSLCQEIVENHGGDIWVESEPGEGSTFSFTIPRREVERY